MTVPDNLNDLRLRALELKAGLQSYVWGITVPGGEKMVVSLDYKIEKNRGQLVYEVNGPIENSFSNHIYLLKEFSPVPGNWGKYEELALEVASGKHATVNSRYGTIPQAFIPSKPSWSSNTSLSAEPIGENWTELFREQDGPQNDPKQIEFTLRVKLVPIPVNLPAGEVSVGKL